VFLIFLKKKKEKKEKNLGSPKNGKHFYLFSVEHFGIWKEFCSKAFTQGILLQQKLGATTL